MLYSSNVTNSAGIKTVSSGSVPTSVPRIHNLKGFEAFTLNYQVKWPLSLVISRQALIKYQLLFRHIFYCKHVERQLSLTWLDHQTVKELNLGMAMGPTFCLRHRMQHFMRNLVYYLSFEVIEPHWCKMTSALTSVTTVDEVLKIHGEFLGNETAYICMHLYIHV